MDLLRHRVVAAGVALLMTVSSVYAEPPTNLKILPNKLNDYFQPFVWESFTYDSNVFRIPNDPPVVDPNCDGRGATECWLGRLSPDARKTDYINQLTLGSKILVPFSRQLWTVNLLGANNSFVRNSFLNNLSWDTSTALKLEFADAWTGNVGARYARQLAGFGNLRIPGKNMLRFISYFGDVTYKISPRWRVTAGGNWSQTANSLNVRQFADVESTTARFETVYATPLGNSAGLEYAFVQAKYPGRGANLLNGFTRFNEDLPQFVLKYRLSEKITFNGKIGYLWRDFDNKRRNFSGEVWRVGVTWLPTNKTGITTYGYHNIGTYFEDQAQYFFAEGAAIEPVWYPTEKTIISATLNFESRDYPGSGLRGGVQVANERHDSVFSARVAATYTPVDYADISLVYEYGRRGVNGGAASPVDGIGTEIFNYNFDSVGATARLYF